MEKSIILEINRLNELMNLPLIMEGVGDGIKKLVTIIKDALRIAESEKTLLKNYVKGIQLTDDETILLVTALKRDDTIITTLEKQINTPGKLKPNELTEATAKVNDLKSLKNTIHPAEELLIIKRWFHLTEEGKTLYGEFTPFISTKTLNTLEVNKSKFFDGTVDYLDPMKRLELANACEKIGTNIQTLLSKTKLPANKQEVLEESSGFLKSVAKEIKNNPEGAAKKLKGYRKLAWQAIIIMVSSIALIGAYNSSCKTPFIGGIMRFFGFCEGGLDLNNGGGSGGGSNDGGRVNSL
jgi:hypothetical protein